ncbi:cell division protein ZapA [Anaerotignum propionicum]|uniref:Cell division protein ZapA n=1 Tax=Anaerotignum propionicum DSM 1682 TaxID=991789 RepID=A0A110A724_ANAPI|nr:cell division protein ZapA [Anaerotignum propionicum]AMJ40433.1 cell division protein ZapA [Anaerotignum propionicum DSM 1682]SHE42191.1 Cell division protein ZapA, inhibits GTPase activity of FtsZ [[Clostridium] propionicum DSM 1682] [Anaerotignum propionicum DSM 1682]
MKNRIKIIVDGKSFTLVGEETEMHMQAVASYIDDKIVEIRKNAAAVKMDTSLAYVLAALNVADDYFKEKEKVAELEGRNLGLSTRLEELVFQLDEARLEIAELKENFNQAEKEIQVIDNPSLEEFGKVFEIDFEEKLDDKKEEALEESKEEKPETSEEPKVEPHLQTEEKPHFYPMGLKGGQAERIMTQKAKRGKRRRK